MIFLRTLLPFCITLFLVSSLTGQSWKWDLNNAAELNHFQFHSNENDLRGISELRSEHEFELRYKTHLMSNISVKGIYNSVNSDRSRAFLNEANVALSKGKCNMKLGKQVYKFGGLTGLSNLDLANSYDYYDFLITDNEELGHWGIASKIDIGNLQLSLNYIPNVQSSKFYINDNAWANLPTAITHPSEQGVMIPLQFQGINDTDDFGNKQTFNVGLNLELLGLSTRLDYFRGHNDIPFRKLNFDFSSGQIPVEYNLELLVQPLSIYNLNVQRLFGDWNVWAEYGYVKNHIANAEGDLLNDNYSLVSIGFDKFFLFEDPSQMLKIVGQWRHAIWHSGFEYSATDLDHVLDRSFIFDLDYQQSYSLSFGIRSAISYDQLGIYISPSLDYKISQKFSTSIVYDLLTGNDAHFFGHFKNNNRFLLKLKVEI